MRNEQSSQVHTTQDRTMDDTVKGGQNSILGTFNRQSLHAKRFQTPIASLFDDT